MFKEYNHTLVKSNGAEYNYRSIFKELVVGQLVVLEGHARPYFIKEFDEEGRCVISPTSYFEGV